MVRLSIWMTPKPLAEVQTQVFAQDCNIINKLQQILTCHSASYPEGSEKMQESSLGQTQHHKLIQTIWSNERRFLFQLICQKRRSTVIITLADSDMSSNAYPMPELVTFGFMILWHFLYFTLNPNLTWLLELIEASGLAPTITGATY